jgi:hypothetical protein
MKNGCKIFVGKPEKKGPLGRLRCRWKDNMGMYLREIDWAGVDWMYLAQDRDQWKVPLNAVIMNLQVP